MVEREREHQGTLMRGYQMHLTHTQGVMRRVTPLIWISIFLSLIGEWKDERRGISGKQKEMRDATRQ